MRVLILLCPLLFLTACDSTRVIEKPVVHTVTETVWREIPADLTLPCAKAEIPPEATYGDVIALWSEDRASIDACNGKLAGIDSLGDTP